MARRFNGNASNYFLATARSPVIALPVTVACWVNPNLTALGANSGTLVSIQTAGDAKLLCTVNGTAAEFRTSSVNSSNTAAIATSTNVRNNVWNHYAGVFLSSTSRTSYTNGVAGTTNTTSNDATPASLVEVAFGARRATSTYGVPLIGDLSDVAIWNIALTTREIQLLATGVSPLQIRASNLVAYWPLNGRVGSGEASLISEFDYVTIFGTAPVVTDPLSILRNTAKPPKILSRNVYVHKIAPKWVTEVEDKVWGTIATADNSSISTTLTAWEGTRSLMQKSVNTGQAFDGQIVSTYSLVYTTASAYYGGVLAPNGDIHFVPNSATVGQKVASNGIVSTYSLIYTAADAYRGGVLAPNGDIHFVPYSATVGQKISSGGVVSTYSLVYTTSLAYTGGILAPNGDTHFVPNRAGVGQKISSSGVVSTYSVIYTTTSGSYLGGVLAPNGDIHFVPITAPVGQKVSAAGVVSTYSIPATGTSYSQGGVIDSNGNIYFLPGGSDRSGSAPAVGKKISMNGVISTFSVVNQTYSAYTGAVLAPNGDIHFVPRAFFISVGQKISAAGVVSTYSLPYTISDIRCAGGVLAPNGEIHFVPSSAPVGEKITTLPAIPFDPSVCKSPFLNKF